MPPDSVLEHLSVLPRIDRARIEEDSENQVFHLRREVLRLTSINNSVRNEASKEAERMKQRESEWHVTLFERNAELKEANFRISEQSKQIARMQDIILQLKQHVCLHFKIFLIFRSVIRIQHRSLICLCRAHFL